MSVTGLRKLNAVPIVVGVFSSGDAPALTDAALSERFGEIVDRFAKAYTSTPIVVLSSLATRPDFVAAEEAMRRGISVVACLKKPAEEHERDFSSMALEQLRSILDRCSGTIVVENVGSFIAYYSALLVTFGPGARGSPDAATVPVFEIDRLSVREFYPERLGVLNIGKKKKKRAASAQPGRDEFESALRNLDRFNCDIARESIPEAEDALDAFRLRADSASNRLQKWTLHSLRGLYVVAAIAGATQLVVQPPATDVLGGALNTAGTAVRIGVLAIAFLWFKFAKHKDYENRYQDYRAIAEALRVQHAWCSAGLRSCLVENSYLQMQQSELRWIRLALKTIYLVSDARSPQSGDSPDCSECSGWIDGQLKFYEGAAVAQARKQQHIVLSGGVLGAIGGAIGGLAVVLLLANNGVPLGGHLAFLGIHAQHWSLASQWPQLQNAKKSIADWATYLTTVPPTLAGMFALLLGFYAQQRGFTENSRRYQRVFTVFEAAQRKLLEHSGKPEDVLGDLGHEALTEHADWLILHRERPLRVITAPISMQGVQQ